MSYIKQFNEHYILKETHKNSIDLDIKYVFIYDIKIVRYNLETLKQLLMYCLKRLASIFFERCIYLKCMAVTMDANKLDWDTHIT